MDVYPVNYPASDQWDTGIDGIRDAGAHVQSTATNCPKTKMVLGGFSQGAAVMGFVTSPAVPDGVDPATVPKPLQPEVADHVAAVVLFGTPNARAMNFLGEPPVVIGPAYQAKTIKVCAPEDPICSDGLNFAAHNTYANDGTMIDKGAAFAASRLGPPPGTTPPPPPAPPPAPPPRPKASSAGGPQCGSAAVTSECDCRRQQPRLSHLHVRPENRAAISGLISRPATAQATRGPQPGHPRSPACCGAKRSANPASARR
ncbi:hypothetical protein MYXE_20480 [Mycobacterium xenopi]|uniref:Cutinase n=1 Tax=Mycobacterium xenopi TaxID=1789 RepID=A0AAD1GZG2_MYCXE|nr:hypothetical protein MYXE_20480 [Mycobacterium xenopi]